MDMSSTWILLYVTLLIEPLAPEFVLILAPFCDATICVLLKITPSTVLLLLSPTLPMDAPWPP